MSKMIHTDTGIYKGVANPHFDSDNQFALHAPEAGEEPTINELRFIREFDAVGVLACETMPADAFNNWVYTRPNQEENEPDMQMKREFIKGVDISRNFGWCLAVLYDENPDLTEDVTLPALKFRVFPPAGGTSLYGVQKWEYDDYRRPTMFYIRFGADHRDVAEVNARRTVVFTWKRPPNEWRGRSVLYGCWNEIWHYREWRRQLGQRAAQRLPTRYNFNKTSAGNWTPDEKTSVENAMGDTPHILTVNAELRPVTGELQNNELDATLHEHVATIATALKITVADFRGAEAGQKLSVDNNATRYARTLIDIQEHYKPVASELFMKLGRNFTTFNPPWELRTDLVDKNVLALLQGFAQCPDRDLRMLLKGRIMSELKNVRKEQLNEDRPAGTGGFGQQEAGGNTAAEERRDNAPGTNQRRENTRTPRG